MRLAAALRHSRYTTITDTQTAGRASPTTTMCARTAASIAAETGTDKLAAIDFGKALPDSYMQQLTALLSSAGIDITKYTAALTAAN